MFFFGWTKKRKEKHSLDRTDWICLFFWLDQKKEKKNIHVIELIGYVFILGLDQKKEKKNIHVIELIGYICRYGLSPPPRALVKLIENRNRKLFGRNYLHPTSIWWNLKEKSDLVKSRYDEEELRWSEIWLRKNNLNNEEPTRRKRHLSNIWGDVLRVWLFRRKKGLGPSCFVLAAGLQPSLASKSEAIKDKRQKRTILQNEKCRQAGNQKAKKATMNNNHRGKAGAENL